MDSFCIQEMLRGRIRNHLHDDIILVFLCIKQTHCHIINAAIFTKIDLNENLFCLYWFGEFFTCTMLILFINSISWFEKRLKETSHINLPRTVLVFFSNLFCSFSHSVSELNYSLSKMKYHLVSIVLLNKTQIKQNKEITKFLLYIVLCVKKIAIFFLKFSAISFYFVTFSVAQCMPVETTSEKVNMPVMAITTSAPPPSPEIISYEYTKNDTGYMYR